jgi:hypothetical protein
VPRSAAYRRCQDLLPDLSKEELKDIILRANALAGMGRVAEAIAPTTKGNLLDQDDWLAYAIGRAMVRRGQFTTKNASMRLALAARITPTYKEAGLAQREWLLAQVGRQEPLLEYELQYLGDVVINALMNNLSWMNGLDAETLMRNIDRIPKALDAELPGYATNKMLGLLIPRKGNTDGGE